MLFERRQLLFALFFFWMGDVASVGSLGIYTGYPTSATCGSLPRALWSVRWSMPHGRSGFGSRRLRVGVGLTSWHAPPPPAPAGLSAHPWEAVTAIGENCRGHLKEVLWGR